MKKLLVIILALVAIKAYACTTQTVIIDGRMFTCTTCGNVTDCFS
jgi:hypothetical protein